MCHSYLSSKKKDHKMEKLPCKGLWYAVCSTQSGVTTSGRDKCGCWCQFVVLVVALLQAVSINQMPRLFICVYVCMSIYIYIYTYIHTLVIKIENSCEYIHRKMLLYRSGYPNAATFAVLTKILGSYWWWISHFAVPSPDIQEINSLRLQPSNRLAYTT